jgi:uncharacterized RDD family membrane protein YckC
MTDESEHATYASSAAGLALRLAAMIYEAVLLVGVVFVISYALLVSLQWSYPLPPTQRTLLQIALFVVIGTYFVVCWTRTGQTLALKAWRLKVVDSEGRAPHARRAIARYVLAWHLWLPGLAIAGLFQLSAGASLAALAVSFALLLIPALIDRRRRLLHDLWTGTRVVRVPG